ncbi:MAG: LacI family transcriptional regulator [Chloroflexi bacterium]|nr:LacI family transcriptional regulator [Chloroflexota bacterium]
MPTIHDVAKRAGVAPITVSRVINNSGYCSDDTRRRVEAAIAELGYVPNVIARSLRSKRTNTLALVITDITNPFFTVVARGVEDTASDAGFMVIYCNTDESVQEEEKYLNLLAQKQVDGILLVPARSAARPVALIQARGLPVVILDRKVPHANADVVRSDSETGAHRLTQLLLDQGHKRIAILSGPHGVSTAEDRAAGFLRAMTEAGLGKNAAVMFGAHTHASGYEMAQRVLAYSPRPTALFAGNNFIAFGAMKALREAGLSIPEDISLVAFDDLPPTLTVEPFITVAAQPAYEMGRIATHLMVDRLRGQAPQECQEILLPTEIVVRRSIGPAKED